MQVKGVFLLIIAASWEIPMGVYDQGIIDNYGMLQGYLVTVCPDIVLLICDISDWNAGISSRVVLH